MKKVKFLTVVWGESYIKRFCALSLPSFLAHGNLPELAEHFDLKVVIMTREIDVPVFKKIKAFNLLRSLCKVRFVPIDDLITDGIYGVTLTLAYARPIIQAGNDMVNIHFVFMNADFILAQGSLKSLAKLIKDDARIIMAPSYRAIANYLEPRLKKRIDSDSGLLEIPPRELVRMSLKHPHRTTVAKTFNQSAFSSSHPNQLFWNIDKNTLLGRYYLIFMLSLKPERVITSINGYCDYSFVPDLCPTSSEAVISDSDDFFMLELQERTQESFMLRPRPNTVADIAKSLKEWTTAEHRNISKHDIIFHSEEIPVDVDRFRREASNTIVEINKRLGAPKPHADHYYWTMGVEAWKEHRSHQGLSTSPPELGKYKLSLIGRYNILRHQLVLLLRQTNSKRNYIEFFLRGFKPNSILSHHYRAWRLHSRLLNDISGLNEPFLVIASCPDQLKPFGKIPQMTVLIALKKPVSHEIFRTIVLLYDRDFNPNIKQMLHLAMSFIREEGSIHILVRNNPYGGNDTIGNMKDLLLDAGECAGNGLVSLSFRSNGGWLSSKSTRLRYKLYRWVINSGPGVYYRAALGVPLFIFCYAINLMSNVAYLFFGDSNIRLPKNEVSSALASLHIQK